MLQSANSVRRRAWADSRDGASHRDRFWRHPVRRSLRWAQSDPTSSAKRPRGCALGEIFRTHACRWWLAGGDPQVRICGRSPGSDARRPGIPAKLAGRTSSSEAVRTGAGNLRRHGLEQPVTATLFRPGPNFRQVSLASSSAPGCRQTFISHGPVPGSRFAAACTPGLPTPCQCTGDQTIGGASAQLPRRAPAGWAKARGRNHAALRQKLPLSSRARSGTQISARAAGQPRPSPAAVGAQSPRRCPRRSSLPSADADVRPGPRMPSVRSVPQQMPPVGLKGQQRHPPEAPEGSPRPRRRTAAGCLDLQFHLHRFGIMAAGTAVLHFHQCPGPPSTCPNSAQTAEQAAVAPSDPRLPRRVLTAGHSGRHRMDLRRD